MRWQPVSTATTIAASVGLGLLWWAAAASHGFIPMLDHANLAFHEAGHPLFGVFGRTMGLYGGTLGQLVFPPFTIGVFAWRGQPVGVVGGTAWLGENFLNIARYAQDARSQALPLVGGGEHDWTNILSRWGALASDHSVAHGFATVGWIALVAPLA